MDEGFFKADAVDEETPSATALPHEEEEEEEEEAEEAEEAEAEASEEEEENDAPLNERNANVSITNNEEVEEDEEVFIVEIEDLGSFYTNNDTNGNLYEITEDDDVGKQVGVFKDGEVELFE